MGRPQAAAPLLRGTLREELERPTHTVERAGPIKEATPPWLAGKKETSPQITLLVWVALKEATPPSLTAYHENGS